MSGGLLIAGAIVDVPGFDVIGPHDAAWSHLDAGDCCPRHGSPQMIMVHRTIGDDPDVVRPSAGPGGLAERTARSWQDDPRHSGAGVVIGPDGVIACLCDLVLVEAFHATVSNGLSIGIELHELPGGVLFERQLEALVACVKVICEHTGIQFQVPKWSAYNGHPLQRMLDGGRTVYGIVGHRDNTEERGRWDPGDVAYARLAAAGAEVHDLAVGEDLVAWKVRQRELGLVADGLPGPATVAALKAAGYRGGVFALGRGQP